MESGEGLQSIDQGSEALIGRDSATITARIRAIAGRDPFGVERSRLLDALPWEAACEFLKADAKDVDGAEEAWGMRRVKTRGDVLRLIREYLPFAWEKANGARGLSAQRSLSHFRGLVWLLGDQDAIYEQIADVAKYLFYGKPQLILISQLVGFDWRKHDSGEWKQSDGEDGVSREEALREIEMEGQDHG